MTSFQKDLQIILKIIENEINSLNEEYRRIDESVDRDLRTLVADYSEEIDKANLDKDQIMNQYREYLKEKKEEALRRARERLLKLKDEIAISIPPHHLDANPKMEMCSQ